MKHGQHDNCGTTGHYRVNESPLRCGCTACNQTLPAHPELQGRIVTWTPKSAKSLRQAGARPAKNGRIVAWAGVTGLVIVQWCDGNVAAVNIRALSVK